MLSEVFERFTEQARRAIFHSRVAAAEMGTDSIEAYQLLLGTLHADPALRTLFFGDDSLERLRQEFHPHVARAGFSTNQALPLSHETKRVLTYGFEEAERMRSREITTAHLLLGVMRSRDEPVVEALARRGLSVEAARRKLVERFVTVAVDRDSTPGQADVREALQEALAARYVHVGPENAFSGLDFTLAGKSAGGPHTIYEILRHVTYWQETCIAYVSGARPQWPEHAAESWPGPAAPADEKEWRLAVERFSQSLDQLSMWAGRCDLGASTGERTNLQAIQATAQHNSYHLGQVVVLRQLLGAWPPPGGGMTW